MGDISQDRGYFSGVETIRGTGAEVDLGTRNLFLLDLDVGHRGIFDCKNSLSYTFMVCEPFSLRPVTSIKGIFLSGPVRLNIYTMERKGL